MRLVILVFALLAMTACAAPWYACYPRHDADGDALFLCFPLKAPVKESPR